MSTDFFLMSEVERKEYFQTVLLKAKNKLELLDDETFFLLNGLRQYIFSFSTDDEKKQFVSLAAEYINRRGTIAYQLVETLSVVYKILDTECQEIVFDTVFPYCKELLLENRGITTVSIFIKNTHKVYTFEQQIKCKELLKALCDVCTHEELKDTYSYTINNYQKKFVPSKTAKVLLLIAEFQTATSFLQPPLCFLSVATQLKKKSIFYDFLDNRVYSYSTDQLLQFVKQYDYIAITSSPLDQVQTYFLDHRHTIFCQLINEIKNKYPKLKIIVCGAHGTIRSDFVMNNTKTDILIRGEYDFQLPYLLENLILGNDINSIPNLVIRNHDNKIILTKEDKLKMHPIEWQDSLIDYNVIDINDYYGYQYVGNTHLKKKRWSVAQASRGCPYKCIFCYNFYTNSVRYKSIDNLVNELIQMEKMGVSEFFFIDQTFTVDKNYVRTLCKSIIENSIKLNWTCETRVDLIDLETLELMKMAGCIGIWFGIESFDDDVLTINKKDYSRLNYDKMLEVLKQTQIDYRAFIMLGMYGDDYNSLKYTVDKIIENKIHISKTIVKCKERFGTELFDVYTPENVKNEFYCFEQLGLRSGSFASNISENEYELQIKRLMDLNKI